LRDLLIGLQWKYVNDWFHLQEVCDGRWVVEDRTINQDVNDCMKIPASRVMHQEVFLLKKCATDNSRDRQQRLYIDQTSFSTLGCEGSFLKSPGLISYFFKRL